MRSASSQVIKKKKKPRNSVIKFGTDSSLPVYLPTNLQYCLHLKTAEHPSSIYIFISGRKMINDFAFSSVVILHFLSSL